MQSFKKKAKLNSIWQGYIISEKGRASLFSNMERYKLINIALNRAINVNFLVNSKFIMEVFILNDEYELSGLSRRKYFEKLL